MEAFVHVLHAVLAGAWLGGVAFTTLVVSPALKEMKWSVAERMAVRSVIGRHYARVGTANLSLLALFAVLDGIFNRGVMLYTEYVLLLVLFALTAAHGAYFGRRLRELAAAEREARDPAEARERAGRRLALQRVSFGVSMTNLAVSAVVAVLAVAAGL
ncbi:MAG: DUF4149 domain-containing protein [Rubrobacter sp.]|nr:DUF4149 domain-containing protein [Rubrobacter sp.]